MVSSGGGGTSEYGYADVALSGRLSHEAEVMNSLDIPRLPGRPPGMDSDDVSFLDEFVNNGENVKDAVRVVWGGVTSRNRRHAHSLLRRPQARHYIHELRKAHSARIFRTSEDLVVELEKIALDEREKTKYRLRALELLTRILAPKKHEHKHTATVSVEGRTIIGLGPEMLNKIRVGVLGIDPKLVMEATAHENELLEDDHEEKVTTYSAIAPELPPNGGDGG